MCHGGERALQSHRLQMLTLTFPVLYKSDLSSEIITLSVAATVEAITEALIRHPLCVSAAARCFCLCEDTSKVRRTSPKV